MSTLYEAAAFTVAFIVALLRLIPWGIAIYLFFEGAERFTERFFPKQNQRFWRWLGSLSIFR